ncbi:MAG: sensor domain-containing diguanylate cyclase [Mycobacterium sp.]
MANAAETGWGVGEGDGSARQLRPADSAPVSPTLAELVAAADTDQVPVLRALLQMSHAVLCARYFDEALEAIAHHSMLALGAASVSISRWEHQDNVLRTLINVGDLAPGEERWPDDELYPVTGDHKVLRLLQQGLPYINSIDSTDCTAEDLVTLLKVGKECELAVPVMHEDTMWGEIWATGVDGRRFGPDDVQVLQAIAAHTAVAIGRSELFSAVWSQAFEDPLTGLANRRRLDEIFDEMEIDEVHPALLVCDLDGFKAVNDRHGHPAGDELLRTVADALNRTAASTAGSLVARMGGDEFCIVLPRSSLADAEHFAVTATRCITELAGRDISLSWGASVYGSAVNTGPALFGAADSGLLQSKRLGPGRFSVGVVDTDTRGVPSGAVRSRGSDAARLAPDIVPQVVDILDAHGPSTPAAALQILAFQICKTVNAAAWAVSITTDDGGGVRSMQGIESSRDRVSGLRVLAVSDDSTYRLADYPATSRAIQTGEPFLAAVDLPESDPSEVALLEQLGYVAVLGVAATDGTDHYLLEIFSDTGSGELAAIQPHARVLANYCCNPHVRHDQPKPNQP